jgi:hypothetical protein
MKEGLAQIDTGGSAAGLAQSLEIAIFRMSGLDSLPSDISLTVGIKSDSY